MLKNRLFLSVLLLSGTAHGFVGGTHSTNGAPEFVCRARFYNSHDQLVNFCSGTATELSEITLAGHCLGFAMKEKLSARVDCGYQGIDPDPKKRAVERTRMGGSILVKGGHFKETAVAEEFKISRFYPTQPRGTNEITPHDVAKLILKTPLKHIRPLPIVPPSESIVLYTQKGAECRASGLGYRPTRTLIGLAKTVPFTPSWDADWHWLKSDQEARYPTLGEDLFFKLIDLIDAGSNARTAAEASRIQMQTLSVAESSNQFKSFVGPGDSGGPLYCRLSPEAPWVLVGVMSASGFDQLREDAEGGGSNIVGVSYNARWAPTADLQDLIPLENLK